MLEDAGSEDLLRGAGFRIQVRAVMLGGQRGERLGGAVLKDLRDDFVGDLVCRLQQGAVEHF